MIFLGIMVLSNCINKMKPDNVSVIRDDLHLLAELLNQYEICRNVGPIYSSAATLQEVNYTICRCRLQNLEIPFDQLPHSHPHLYYEAFLDLSIDCEFHICNFSDPSFTYPPPSLLNLQTTIRAIDTTGSLYFNCFHIDMHQPQEGDGVNKYIHPMFHFTYGGNQIVENEIERGKLFLTSTPRLVHHPLDIPLSIDFLLRNYISRERLFSLTCDPQYGEILKRCQYRIWRPYYLALAESLSQFPKGKLDSSDYAFRFNPHIIP